MGKNTNNNNASNDVLVQMESLEAKRRIMRNRRLKGSRIYVDDDLTRSEREIQKTIWEQAKKEEAKGRKVKRGYMKLIIRRSVLKMGGKEKKIREKQNV